MLKRLQSEKGFTLIELLIVIVIIGVLAVIVIGLTGTSARRKANDARAKADMHEMQNALELYASDNNDAYPAAGAAWQDDLVPDYMKETKTPPAGAYTYSLDANSDYILSYTLENTNDSGPNVAAGVYTLTARQ